MKRGITARTTFTLVAITLIAFGREQVGQQLGTSGQIGQRQENTAATPVPRRPDGRVILGSLPGGAGMWLPFNGGSERFVNPDNITAEAMQQFPGRPKVSEVPFLLWARELYNYRRANQLEPHTVRQEA